MPDVFVAPEDKKPPTTHSGGPLTNLPEKSKLGRLKSLSSYLIQPPAVTFETQSQNEHIILLLRKHIVTNVPWVLVSIFLFFLPFLFPFLNPIFSISSIPANFQFIGILLWYLFTFSFAFQNFLNWYYNVYIVTDERVIDVDFFSLLYKHISDAQLDKIQDVSYSMGGVGSALFNYGNVYVQTAAEVPNFEFDAVPNPALVVKTIVSLSRDHGALLKGKPL